MIAQWTPSISRRASAAIERGKTMQVTKTITLIRMGQARMLTKGGAIQGQIELDGTFIKTVG